MTAHDLITAHATSHHEHESPSVADVAAELVAIAESLGRSGVARLVGDGPGRRWTYLVETPRFEAVVIAWPAGRGLGLHDHSGSQAAVHVVNGRLRERFVAADGTLQTRWLLSGETVNLPADHVHEVVNTSDDEVFSVHVYSPPLRDKSFRIDNEIEDALADQR